MKRFRLLRNDRGAALVEFAIVLPMLLLLVFGIVDFARAYFIKNNITSAVREGARFYAVQTDWTDTVPVRQRVQSYITSFGGASQYTVRVYWQNATIAGSTERYLVVKVSGYTFQPITPLPTLVGFGTITFTDSAVFRHELQ